VYHPEIRSKVLDLLDWSLLRFDLWGQAMNNTFTSCYQQDGGYGFV
jgi:hypothetical protein